MFSYLYIFLAFITLQVSKKSSKIYFLTHISVCRSSLALCQWALTLPLLPIDLSKLICTFKNETLKQNLTFNFAMVSEKGN